jgi:hypothetical protein
MLGLSSIINQSQLRWFLFMAAGAVSGKRVFQLLKFNGSQSRMFSSQNGPNLGSDVTTSSFASYICLVSIEKVYVDERYNRFFIVHSIQVLFSFCICLFFLK